MIPIIYATELNLIYDANGNLISGDGKFREYNSLNQLSRIRNGSSASDPILQEFVYHPAEERIYMKRTYNSTGQVVETVYYLSKSFVEVENATGRYQFGYAYHEGQLVGQINPDGTRLFMHNDLEGSVGVVTNQSGSVVETTLYSPYGEILSGGIVSKFDSEGKEFSSVTGDYDFHFRKMNPSWGLFLQPDTLIQYVYDPQSLNRYMFERGNPLGRTDPTGHIAPGVAAAIGIGIGFVLGFGNGFISSVYNQARAGGGLSSVNYIEASQRGWAKGIAGGYGSAMGALGLFMLAEGATLAGVALPLGFSTKMALRTTFKHYSGIMGDIEKDILDDFGLEGENSLIDMGLNKGKNIWANFKQNIASSFSSSSRLYQEANRQGIIAAAQSGTYSGEAGYNPDAGAYITEDGKVYPTNNPDFVPCDCPHK